MASSLKFQKDLNEPKEEKDEPKEENDENSTKF
jgi:hypothetical protein